MQHTKLKLAAVVTTTLLATAAHADSWLITQTSNPGSDMAINQNGTTQNASIQGVNVVNASNMAVIHGSQQKANLSSHKLTMNQTGSTTGSTQATNYIKADTIGDGTGTVTQVHVGNGKISFTQDSGTGNLQALNSATAANVTDLTQTATSPADTTLDQNTSGKNTQAINHIAVSSSLTKATQTSHASNGSIGLTQKGSGQQTQAANLVTGKTIGTGLTQSTDAWYPVELTQQDATGGSTQAANMIDAESADGNGSDVQTLNGFSGGGSYNVLRSKQTGSTSGGVQAGNYAKVTGTLGGSKTFQQKYAGNISVSPYGESVQLTQDATGGSNQQYVNAVDAGTVTDLSQDVTSAPDAKLTQSASGTGNIQAVNNAYASTTLTKVVQKAQPTTTFTLTQSAGTSNTQAANRVNTPGTLGDATQTAGLSGTTVSLDQQGGAGSLQALNTVTATGAVTSLTQNAYGTISLEQGKTTAAGAGSVQAGNHFAAKSTAGNINQTFGSSTDLSLKQHQAASGTVQAGNLIDMSGSTGALANATQKVVATGGTFTLLQDTTSTGSLQAGNAVLAAADGSSGGGTVDQDVKASTLSMTQTGSVGAFQAANYLGKPIL